MYNNRGGVNQKLVLIGIVFLQISTVVGAGVVFDGSIGPSGPLAGPDITIPDTAGKTAGNNLFHSFSEFSIEATESATFTGPANIDNILSRVTGGEQSNLNGRLASDISGANLYFLNPAGVMFGPDASLDVKGGFHVSTANYIRMKDGSRFNVVPSSTKDLQLTAALPEAFGFLNNKPAGISIDRSNLTVPDGGALSVIGGEVIIKGKEKGFPSFDDFPLGAHLNASSGRINLVSVASGGEVVITAEDLDISDFDSLGEIEIKDGALVDVSGDGGGEILVRAEALMIDNSLLQANTSGSISGASVDINAHTVKITDGRINTETSGVGQSGMITIRGATSVTIDSPNRGTKFSVFYRKKKTSGLFADVVGEKSNGGKGESIYIETEDFTLSNGAFLKTYAAGDRDGGNITINATGNVTITGQNSEKAAAAIFADSSGEGSAGEIHIHANNLLLTNGAALFTRATGNGGAGKITILAQHNVELSGEGEIDNEPGWIWTRSENSDAGDITVIANNLFMKDGVFVDSSTASSSDAGNVQVDLTGQLFMTGDSQQVNRATTNITSSTVGRLPESGSSGFISIKADSIELVDGARIFSETTGTGSGNKIEITTNYLSLRGTSSSNPEIETRIDTSTSYKEPGAGKAGDIFITATKRIDILNGAKIHAESQGAGAGGNLTIRAPVVSIFDQGGISSKSKTARGDAGNIELSNLIQLRMDKKSKIETSAVAANGGNISVAASYLVDLDDYSSITTSVGDGTGNGGFIKLDTEFITMSVSEITAKARNGNAGDILASNGLLIASPDSVLSINSERGNDGTIVVKETTEDINSQIGNPIVGFLDTAKVTDIPCADRSGADVIVLENLKYQLLPESPYALRKRFPAFIKNASMTKNLARAQPVVVSASGIMRQRCGY